MPAQRTLGTRARWAIRASTDELAAITGHNGTMLDMNTLTANDLKGLSKNAVVELAAQMLAQLQANSDEIARRDDEIKVKDAKLERLTFELARLKAWRFGAKTEAMDAQQRRLFEETLAEDQASLEEQLRTLQEDKPADSPAKDTKRKPRRQPLPDHLRRVEHRHEPQDTTCGCGNPMLRIGEDVSERLDIVPAEFFVHRHIRGKWACKCCEKLVQEPVDPQVIDKGMPAPRVDRPHAGQPLRGSLTVLPAGADQRTLGRAHASLDAGGVGGHGRSWPDPTVRGAPRLRAGLPGTARRRDAG
jgi:hypothetical protein